MLDVHADGVWSQEQALGDHRIAVALGHQEHHATAALGHGGTQILGNSIALGKA